MNSREIAVNALIKWRRNGSWPDLYLKTQTAAMDSRDASLATVITYGTLQNLMYIDYCIEQFSTIKLKKITPQVLDVMRITAWQILFGSDIPKRAAVDEGVKLVKKYGNPRAGGFANAIFRRLTEIEQPLIANTGNIISDYSIQYSHPVSYVEYIYSKLGEQGCRELLLANNESPENVARVNTLKTTTEKLLDSLKNEGISAQPHPNLKDAIVFQKLKGVFATKSFADGLFYIQDSAAQLAVNVLNPAADDFVIDMCAAPGGKSMLAAQMMECKGKVLAIDLHPHKTEIIEQNAIKYGTSIIETVAADASKPAFGLFAKADKIICDVPCSGLGIIRKKPDIRFKEIAEFKQLPTLQLEILSTASKYLKPGGTMVYSTCTVISEENEDVINSFLLDNDNYELMPFSTAITGECNGFVTLWPHIHNTDGFFICKLRRKF